MNNKLLEEKYSHNNQIHLLVLKKNLQVIENNLNKQEKLAKITFLLLNQKYKKLQLIEDSIKLHKVIKIFLHHLIKNMAVVEM